MIFAVAWSEFDRNDRLIVKQKEFKTEKAMSSFIAKLENKNNFNEVIAVSYE